MLLRKPKQTPDFVTTQEKRKNITCFNVFPLVVTLWFSLEEKSNKLRCHI